MAIEVDQKLIFPDQFDLKENPDYDDALMIYDAKAGKVKQTKMEAIQAAAGNNVIGSMTPSGSPSGSEVAGQSYRVDNKTGDVLVFPNFLDSNGDPVQMEADERSGYIVKNPDGWAYSDNTAQTDTSDLVPKTEFEPVKETVDNSVIGVTAKHATTGQAIEIDNHITSALNKFGGLSATVSGSAAGELNYLKLTKNWTDHNKISVTIGEFTGNPAFGFGFGTPQDKDLGSFCGSFFRSNGQIFGISMNEGAFNAHGFTPDYTEDGADFVAGDVLEIEFDTINQILHFNKNGVLVYSHTYYTAAPLFGTGGIHPSGEIYLIFRDDMAVTDVKINDISSLTSTDKIINSITVNTTASAPAAPPAFFEAYTVVKNTDGDGATLGATGLAYNNKTGEFIVSEYGFAKSSRILIYKRENLTPYSDAGTITPAPIKILDITEFIIHLQGCAYDAITDTYWAIGTAPGSSQTPANNIIIQIDKQGRLLLSKNISYVNGQVGMIDFDPITGNIYISRNDGYQLYLLSRNSLEILNIITTTQIWEGMCVDKRNGNIWVAGDDGKIVIMDKDGNVLYTGSFATFPNENDRTNVEGMAVLEDGTGVISADCFLHGGTNNGNGLYFFDFLGTAKRKITVPLLSGSGNITPYGKFQGISISDTYLSPIIDTNVLPSSVVINPNYQGLIKYRGASNKEGVLTAAWESYLPSQRFIQMQLS